MLLRRLVLVFSIVSCGLLGLAVGVLGAGGGLAPGSYTFNSKSADACFGCTKGGPTPQPTFSVFVNQGLNTFQAEDGDGAGTVTKSTMVQFTMFIPNGPSGSGCFVIDSSDFSVSKDLQRATLSTTLTSDRLCPGIGKPMGSAQPAGVPVKGGGLPASIHVDVTWTGAHVVSTSRDKFTFTCLERHEDGTNTFRNSLGGSASGTIAGLSVNTSSASVSSQDGQLEVQGSSTPPCFG